MLAIVLTFTASATTVGQTKQVIGEVIRPVNAQAGAGETSYPVLRLQPGERVNVVAIKFDRWLQIEPPEGSFCLVPAGHVTRSGNADFPSEGTAVRDLNVRIASQINEMKWDFAPSRITAGSKLTILGETDDAYYRIPPPADVFYYVPKDSLRPVGTSETGNDGAVAANEDSATDVDPVVDDTADAPETAEVTEMPDDPADTAVAGFDEPDTDGTRVPLAGEGDTPDVVAQVPATRPASLSSESAAERMLALEQRFNEEVAKPIDEQDLDSLLAEYAALADTGELGEADSDLVALRLEGIEKRRAAIEQYKQVQQMRREMEEQQAQLEAENAQHQEQLQAANLKNYVAVGVLRTSKLRLGRQTLFRLTDPNTGRTLVYVRAEPGEMSALMTERLGTFVGIDGTLVEDPRINLSYLTPMAIDSLDPADVYKTVTADMIPPTLTRGE